MKMGDLGRAPRGWWLALCAIAASATSMASSQAAVVISTAPTKNMNCSAGMCTPTAKKAVLNVGDLANLLAAGDVKVVSDSTAVDIQFAAPLSWTSTSRLTLDSYRSIVFQQPISVTGIGALTITTNDGGTAGDFSFEKKGRVEFWDLHSSLITNGIAFTLVKNIKQLASAVTSDPYGNYALAKSYNASRDGVYAEPPVISPAGITLSHASGAVSGTGNIGGLFGASLATGYIYIDQSFATGTVSGNGNVGGLVGWTTASIERSYATGAVSGITGSNVGGLIGKSGAFVSQTYSTGAVTGSGGGNIGGLIGEDDHSLLSSNYWGLDTSGISDPSRGAGNIANDPGITGLTTAQFQAELPAGFDPSVWGESAKLNRGLPYLLANPPPK